LYLAAHPLDSPQGRLGTVPVVVDPERRWLTDRLLIEPLTRAHAAELFPGLNDPGLHEFIGGEPLTLAELTARYARWESRRSPDGTYHWCNWLIRRLADRAAIGTLQATVPVAGPHAGAAEFAWVIVAAAQGHGYAGEAAASLVEAYVAEGWTAIAYIRPNHVASQRVAHAAGLRPTAIQLDGEVRWQRNPAR
jgi:RimJ/RimL family protein N-acetyltransferase